MAPANLHLNHPLRREPGFHIATLCPQGTTQCLAPHLLPRLLVTGYCVCAVMTSTGTVHTSDSERATPGLGGIPRRKVVEEGVGVFFPSHPSRNREDSQVYRNGQQSIQPQPSPKHAPLNNEVNICQSSLFPLPWRTKALPHPDVLKYIQNMSCSICFTQRQPKAPCTLACLQAHLPMSLASWCASHVHAHTHTHWTAPGTLTLRSPSASLTCIDTLHV